MEVRIKEGNGYVDADWTIEDGVMVVSPKEVKFEPKDGDVLIGKAGFPFIFKCFEDNRVHSYCGIDINGRLKFESNDWTTIKSLKPATEEEKKLLFDKLAGKELAWDAEKKELVKLKWKPKNDELYCRPMFSGGRFTCYKERWDNVNYELFFYNKGWVFKTEQECQEFCNRLNEAINSVKP